MEKQFCPYCMAPVTPGEPCGVCGLTEGSYTPSPHHLPPGTVLRERYLVGRVLGEGGFGITYIGCDLRLELKVAIKEYFPTDRANRVSSAGLSVSSYTGAAGSRYEAGKERFLQEARTMAKMAKMPVIVSVRDFFEINNTAYIVMEYVEGTTFKDLVAQRGGRIGAGELMHMIEPIFFALKSMHALGLIHRDISPENIMMEHGEVRLIDFGCARESNNGGDTMTIALKHGYAPVEQYQSKGQGPWTDVYALAATIYYCLTGRKPPQAMDRLVEDELIPPRKLGAELTARQETALLRGMGTLPKRRFQSMDEFHTALYTGEPVPEGAPQEEQAAPPVQEDGPSVTMPAEEAAGVEIPLAGEKKPPANWQALARKYWPAAAGVAAALVLAVSLAMWKPWAGKAPDPDGVPVMGSVDNTPAADSRDGASTGDGAPAAVDGARAVTDEESLALFQNAVTYSGNSEEEFRALLADPAVESIYLENGVYFDLDDGGLVINKPVRIGRGGGLGFITPVTIGEGGHLRVMGNADVVGLLRTTGGGSVLVGEGGQVGDCGMVWLEREADLAMDGGEMDIPQERLLVFSEDVFEDAVHVATLAEYNNARARTDVSAIVIDGDISFAGQGNRNHIVPVLISEGVTVTAPVVDDPTTGEAVSYDAWDVDGTVLVNRGTFLGRVVLGSWDNPGKMPAMINYGAVQADFYNDGGTGDGCGILVNLGTLSVPRGDFHQMSFANLGTMLHGKLAPEGLEAVDVTGDFDPHYYLNFHSGSFYNSGVIRLEGAGEDYQSGICTLDLANGIQVNNVGRVEAGVFATLQNESWMRNFGEIYVAEGGLLENMGGLIDNCSERSMLDAANGCYSVGIIQTADPARVSLHEDTFIHGGALMDFSWGGRADNPASVEVTDAKGLLEALADESVEVVVVNAPVSEDRSERLEVRIGLDEPLVVTKGLAIAGGCQMSVPGLTVKGENAFLQADIPIDLMGGELRIEDRAVGVVSRPENCGRIVAGDMARAALTGGGDLDQGVEISVSDGGQLSSICGLKLDGARVPVDGGVLRFCDGVEMSGCTVDVAKDGNGGELLVNNGNVLLDRDTNIHIYNEGGMVLGGSVNDLNGTIVNDSRLEMHADGYGNTTIRGRVVNHGTLHLWGNQWTRPLVSGGALENDGTVEFDGGGKFRAVDGGVISGVPEEYAE